MTAHSVLLGPTGHPAATGSHRVNLAQTNVLTGIGSRCFMTSIWGENLPIRIPPFMRLSEGNLGECDTGGGGGVWEDDRANRR